MRKRIPILILAVAVAAVAATIQAQEDIKGPTHDPVVHQYICDEAFELYRRLVANPDAQIRQWVWNGAAHEDEQDHVCGNSSVLVTYTHFWDADAGDFDPVDAMDDAVAAFCLALGYRTTDKWNWNAWMKAATLLDMARDAHKQGNQEAAYEYLGHVCHLIGDMGLPAHVHEDLHTFNIPVLQEDDDSYEDWMYETGSYVLWDWWSANSAGGLIEVPEVIGSYNIQNVSFALKQHTRIQDSLYYLLYTTNQVTDRFASDEKDGDSNDRHGWVDYTGFPNSPTIAEHLRDSSVVGWKGPWYDPILVYRACDNDTWWIWAGFMAIPEDDYDNDHDGDLSAIADHAFVYSIRAVATLYKAWFEYLEARNLSVTVGGNLVGSTCLAVADGQKVDGEQTSAAGHEFIIDAIAGAYWGAAPNLTLKIDGSNRTPASWPAHVTLPLGRHNAQVIVKDALSGDSTCLQFDLVVADTKPPKLNVTVNGTPVEHGAILAFGENASGQCDEPAGSEFVQVAAGYRHSVALRADGSLVAWGDNGKGQCDVPAGSDFVQVAAGYRHSVALRADASLAVWGDNDAGQRNVPGETHFVQVAAGAFHSVALRSDGTVVAWGENGSHQCDALPLPPGVTYTQVAAGYRHSVALRSDGKVVAWGDSGSHQCDVPPLPPGVTYTQVAAGSWHSVALRSDGTVVAWGHNEDGKCNAPSGTDFVQVAAGGRHSVALKADGSFEVWGWPWGMTPGSIKFPNVPPGTDLVQVAAGGMHTVFLGRQRFPVEQITLAGSVFAVAAAVEDVCDTAPDLTVAVDGQPASWPASLQLQLGLHRAVVTATDDAGNKATFPVNLEVVDTTPPILSYVPPPVTVEQAGRDGSTANIGMAAATDICDTSPEITNNAPSVFPLGNTTVTWTAKDGSGNAATATQRVTVVDTTPPQLTVPSAVTLEQTNWAGTPMPWNKGDIVAWGFNFDGQLNNVPAGADFIQLAAGWLHTVALKADGSLVAWGNDDYDQFDNMPAGTDFVQVAAGGAHNVALKADGSLAAWGNNVLGQLDNVPEGDDFVQVTAGYVHSVALKSDGHLVVWGSNDLGQLNTVPPWVSDLHFQEEAPGVYRSVETDFIQVAAGDWHNVALRANGSLVAWGSNKDGQLNNLPVGSGFVQVAAGVSHNVALKADGRMVAWGNNDYGQLSEVPYFYALHWVEDTPGVYRSVENDFVQVAAGEKHSVALRSNGRLVAWGRHSIVLEPGTNRPSVMPETVAVPEGNDFVQVAAGANHNVALRRGGFSVVSDICDADPTVTHDAPGVFPLGKTTVTWTATDASGNSTVGTLEVTVTDTAPPTIRNVPDPITVVQSSLAGTPAIVDLPDATDRCDVAPTVTSDAPTVFPLGTTTVTFTATDDAGNVATAETSVKVVDGAPPNLTVTVDGTPVCQGEIVSWKASGPSLAVPAGTDFVQVAARDKFWVALKKDGSLVAWGDNQYGQCNVPAGNDFVQAAAGMYHGVALKKDGSLVAWGLDWPGLLDVPDGNDFVQIGAGTAHSVALKTDGNLVAWGENTDDQCNVPPLPPGVTYTQVAAGDRHNVAVRSDGSLVAWGRNYYGRCDVPGGNSFAQVAAGGIHGVAVRTDGSLALWSENLYLRYNTPPGNDFVQVAAGYRFCVALKSDGSLVAWGINEGGGTNVFAPPGNGFVRVVAGGYAIVALTREPVQAEQTSAAGRPFVFGAIVDDICDAAPDLTLTVDGQDQTPVAWPVPVELQLGAHTVVIAAADNSGHVSSFKVNLEIVDTTPPELAVPADMTVEQETADGIAVAWTCTAPDICDAAPSIVCDPPLGTVFPLGGPHVVTCTATDASGNTAAESFTVTVVDTTPPSLTVPADITVEQATADGTAVEWTCTATDICDAAPTVACNPPSGTVFPLGGPHVVTCTATDASGNTATESFTVTVVDTTPPSLTMPADIIVEQATANGTTVEWTCTATDICDAAPTVVCDPPSGTVFPLGGPQQVTCTATDASGNTATESFTVTVVDTTPPSLTVPADITVEQETADGTAVEWTCTVSDICDAAPMVVCDPPSGAVFPLGGPHNVLCTATDAAGNTTSQMFTVTVVDSTAPALTVAVNGEPANAPDVGIVAWGRNSHGQCDVPAETGFIGVAAGYEHSLALRSDGSLAAWGDNRSGQCDVPSGPDFTQVDAGCSHSVALKADGSLAAWGDNNWGQCNPPSGADYVQVAAGWFHNVALRADGSLVAWGDNKHGQCDVPLGTDFVRVTAGNNHNVALKADGSLVAWGYNGDGQCDVPSGNDFVHLATGDLHSVALKTDGSLVAWGANWDGQCDVPAGNDFVQLAAGACHSVALKADGRLVAWGADANGQCDVPAGNNFLQVTAGANHNVALAEAPRTFSAEQSTPDGHVFVIEAGATDVCDATPDLTLTVDGEDRTPASWPVSVVLALGFHTAVVTATDASGNSSSVFLGVNVVDTTPPTFTMKTLKDALWPPNHEMYCCAVVSGVSDICDAQPDVRITVTSNEAINGKGDGNTDYDWEVVKNGDVWEIWLRAERAGLDTGREYYVGCEVTDDAGNCATASVTVVVAHDQRTEKD